MSLLKHVTTKRCPHCGCKEVVKESIEYSVYCGNDGEIRTIHVHCNGTRNEVRQFLCGNRVEYNFQKDFDKGGCTQSDEYKRLQEKEKQDEEKLREFVEKNNIKRSVITKLYYS